MAMALEKVELGASGNPLFGKFLRVSSAKQMCELVLSLEKSGQYPNELVSDMKVLAFMKFEKTLGIKNYRFNCNNAKRYRTELYFEPHVKNKVVLFISVKDSKNENKMRARLFDDHKDQLLEALGGGDADG